MKVQYIFPTILGKLYLEANEKNLLGIYWKKTETTLVKDISGHKVLLQTVNQIEKFLAKKIKKFDLPIHLDGTEFQMKVWKELQKIPYGETISYKELALRIKNPKAVRAVGTANGKNPFCLIIPCHRVIAHDGSLGGYAGGIPAKEILLKLEEK